MVDRPPQDLNPALAGVQPDRLARLDHLIHEALQDGIFPGAVLLVMRSDGIVKRAAYGQAIVTPSARPMTEDTLFDLASLTKVVVTAPLALMLAERGHWCLTDPVARYIDEFAMIDDRAISLWHLLTHTSGLPAWANLFYNNSGFDELFKGKWPILTPVAPPQDRVIYSDLGFILLGEAIQRTMETSLEELAQAELFQPLGMQDAQYNPPSSMADRVAATEDDPRRDGVRLAQVHDENAEALGGVSGHAGLFATAADLARYTQMLLHDGRSPDDRVLAQASVRAMRAPQTEPLNERRGLGWFLQRHDTPTSGDLLSTSAFGHTGFTGTSLWIDPDHDVGTILLTNRAHPERNRGLSEINRVRARVHNTVMGAIDD